MSEYMLILVFVGEIMRRFLALILCIVLLVTFVGCGKKDRFKDEEVIFDATVETSAESDSSDLKPEESSSVEGETEESEDTTVDASQSQSSEEQKPEEADKPVNNTSETKNKEKVTGIELIEVDGVYFPEVDDLYVPAAKVYYELTSGNLPVDWDLGRFEFTVEGSTNTYWRMSDSRFDSVEELESYLKAYFTEDFIKTFYDPSLFHDHNGHLYAVTGVSGDNILFAGREFKLTKQTTKRIMFDCVSYFYKSPEEIPADRVLFSKVPEDVSAFNTSTVSFVLEVDESGFNWKFSEFGNIK